MLGTETYSQNKNQMHRRINEEALRKDILNEKYILLVKLAFDNKQMVAKFRKAMEDNYTGKFEIVPYNTKIDPTYPDTSIYRYILAAPHSLSKKDFTGANAEVANDLKGIAPTSAWSKDFHIVDRKDLANFWNTNLSGQDEVKVMKYLAARLCGKDPAEE